MVLNEQQNLQHAIIAMERITFLIGRCTIYEGLYLCEDIKDPDIVESAGLVDSTDIAKTATAELRRALVILYSAILQVLTRCIKIFNGMLS